MNKLIRTFTNLQIHRKVWRTQKFHASSFLSKWLLADCMTSSEDFNLCKQGQNQSDLQGLGFWVETIQVRKYGEMLLQVQGLTDLWHLHDHVRQEAQRNRSFGGSSSKTSRLHDLTCKLSSSKKHHTTLDATCKPILGITKDCLIKQFLLNVVA